MAEKKIAGMEVKVDRPLATESLKLQARLMRAAGGDIQSLMESGLQALRAAVEMKSAEAAGDAAKVADAQEKTMKIGGSLLGYVAEIFERLTPDEYATLVSDIVGLAKIKRPSGHYETAHLDADFSENLGAIIPVVAFVLKEVFGDFFSAALANGSRGIAGRA